MKQRGPDALLVFLVPPSLEELFQRLRSRATETAEQLELRQRNAAIELARQGDYDRVVVNETDQVDADRGRDRGDHRAGEARATPDRRVKHRPEGGHGCSPFEPDPRRRRAGAGSRLRGRAGRPRPACLDVPRPGGARGPRGGRGRAGAVRASPGDRDRPGRDGSCAASQRRATTRPPRPSQAHRRARPHRRAAAAAARHSASRSGIAGRYLAPVAAVVCGRCCRPGSWSGSSWWSRSTPDGEARTGRAEVPGLPPADIALLDDVAGRPRPARDLASPEGRGALLRRLRSLARRGSRWTWRGRCSGTTAGPRYERRLWLTPTGVEASARLRSGSRPPGRPLGPRQAAALDELDGPPDAAPGAAGRRARRAPRRPPRLVGARRPRPARARARARCASGLVDRWPARPVPSRGARPADADLTPDQAAASTSWSRRSPRATRRRSCSTASPAAARPPIYVEAIAACLAAGRPALLLVPEIALATPLVDRLRADLDVADRCAAFGARRGRAGGRVAADPGGRGRRRGRDADWPSWRPAGRRGR